MAAVATVPRVEGFPARFARRFLMIVVPVAAALSVARWVLWSGGIPAVAILAGELTYGAAAPVAVSLSIRWRTAGASADCTGCGKPDNYCTCWYTA